MAKSKSTFEKMQREKAKREKREAKRKSKENKEKEDHIDFENMSAEEFIKAHNEENDEELNLDFF